MRTLPLLLLLLLGVTGCAHTRPWSARTLPACAARTGVPELDRERSYLATLLALDARQYAIVHAVSGREIEATYSPNYPPSQPSARWVLSVLDDARVVLDVPSTAGPISEREEQWAERLAFSITQNQCRELDWLRWEAQNRGLIAVGAGPVASGPPPLVAGGEQPGPAAASLASPRAAQVAALRQERAKIRIAPPAAAAAVGVGFTAAGVSLLAQGLIYLADGCDEDGDWSDCSSRDTGRILAPIGGGLLGAGLISLSVGLPIMLRRLRRARELSRQIKALQTLQVGPQSGRRGLGLVFGGAF
jgi:hypothetical protein